MRICVVYDCLFPYTIGGAERWYRNLAEGLAAQGHEVTYLTLRQWDRSSTPSVSGVNVRSVAPRMGLYAEAGRRRILPPVIFGLGVFLHLIRWGRRYDVVHTASFPYFSLLAMAIVRRLAGFTIVVDWHEVWTRSYWSEYLGQLGGRIGWLVQARCARVRQTAYCFSELHAARLRKAGLRGDVTVLRGEYAGPLEGRPAEAADPLVVFAGRLIPEKRVTLAVAAVAAARRQIPDLQAVFYGAGPEWAALKQSIEHHGLQGIARAPGFAPSEEVTSDLRRALCLLLPSRREGYGMVVIEAAACATPSVLVAGDDNAATELIQDRLNGIIVNEPEPEAIADAIIEIFEAGLRFREQTATWFAESRDWLTLESSLATVLSGYGGGVADPSRQLTSA